MPALKHACLEALESKDEPGDPTFFFSIVDPRSVLELGNLAEASITDEEDKALHNVIAELGGYIQRAAPGLEAEQLLPRAKQIVGLTTFDPI
jgi:hypothetical protein